MENNISIKIYVGFITYGKSTAKYLPYFLPSLIGQTVKNIKISAIDNSEEEINENSEFIRINYPQVDFKWAGKNLGFAKAYNLMIAEAVKEGAEYFLAVNPDMILESNFIEKLIKIMASDEKIAAVAPKLLKWDFENGSKTNIIDSLGLSITKEHRFSDAAQGNIDDNRQVNNKEIFAFTGAAVLFRVKALEDVAYRPPLSARGGSAFGGNLPLSKGGKEEEVQYFDELMFMYKEDCDLSYRLRLAGWKIILAPIAVAYHDRTASPKGESNLRIAINRKNKSRLIKSWSFLNHWILLLKIKKLPFSRRIKIATAWYQFKNLVFVILFEQYLLKELINLWKMRGEVKNKRAQLKVRVDIKEIEKFMS